MALPLFAVAMASPSVHPIVLSLVLAGLGLCALCSLQVPRPTLRRVVLSLIVMGAIGLWLGGRELFAVLYPCGNLWWPFC